MSELARLRNIRARKPVTAEEDRDVRAAFERGGTLLSAQVEMLVEAWRTGALLALAPVGTGKTLVTACLARVMGLTGADTVLLVPSSLVKKTEAELDGYEGDFDIERPARIMSLDSLSQGNDNKVWASLLADPPKLLIIDEAHKIGHKSVRAKRLAKYLAKQAIRVVALSGTLERKDYHLQCAVAALALGTSSPLPITWVGGAQLAGVLDEAPSMSDLRSGSGPAARKFITGWIGALPFVNGKAEGRRRVQVKVATAEGVYAPEYSAAAVPITVEQWSGHLTLAQQRALACLDEFWMDPAGNALTSAAHVHDLGLQLTQGFYYCTEWPDGEPNFEYLEARRQWTQTVREHARRSVKNDSEAKIRRALAEKRLKSQGLLRAMARWDAVKDSARPVQKAVWLTDQPILDVLEQVRLQGGPVLVWCHHRAAAARLEALSGGTVTELAPGQVPEPGRSWALTLQAHGTGHNLQAWCRNVFLSYQSTEYLIEQTLGRTHRHLQSEPVLAVFNCTGRLGDEFTTLVQRTRVLVEKTGRPQKLLLGLK